MKPTPRPRQLVCSFSVKLLAGCIALGLLQSEFALALEGSDVTAVGRVSLVLGKAYIEKPDGARELIKVGTQVNESDRIETGSNGLVHVRFVDDELVSVRASSLLEILRYDYDAATPSNSVVKLNLVEGVTRAISGKAAQAARENFRMNTPIAAIGVRGTDFVVSANSDGVQAQVTEGAIVIAPFSAECSAAAFGPCSLNALELAGGANQIVQINANTNEALLLSLSTPALPSVPVPAATTAAVVTPSEKKAKDEALYTDSVTSRVVTLAFATARNASPVAPGLLPPVTEYTPDISAGAATLTSKQLVWGRWYNSISELERITVFREAAIADGRRITVGSDVYGLYRSEPTGEELTRGLDVLGFTLNQAQVVLNTGGQPDLMNVTGGMLNIDFNQNQYSTSLQMNHAAVGNVEFSDSGRIFSNGIFRSFTRDAAGSLAGAVSTDGTEAGYFFEKTLQSGVIEGLTLWGVKP